MALPPTRSYHGRRWAVRAPRLEPRPQWPRRSRCAAPWSSSEVSRESGSSLTSTTTEDASTFPSSRSGAPNRDHPQSRVPHRSMLSSVLPCRLEARDEDCRRWSQTENPSPPVSRCPCGRLRPRTWPEMADKSRWTSTLCPGRTLSCRINETLLTAHTVYLAPLRSTSTHRPDRGLIPPPRR
jgi:hypothetical protein